MTIWEFLLLGSVEESNSSAMAIGIAGVGGAVLISALSLGYKPPRSLRYPTIKSKTDQNYIQSSTAVKTIKLKVGGKATVYQGTKLKIRCPVKKVSR